MSVTAPTFYPDYGTESQAQRPLQQMAHTACIEKWRQCPRFSGETNYDNSSHWFQFSFTFLWNTKVTEKNFGNYYQLWRKAHLCREIGTVSASEFYSSNTATEQTVPMHVDP